MGQFSVEKPVLPGSVLSGNQQTAHQRPKWLPDRQTPASRKSRPAALQRLPATISWKLPLFPGSPLFWRQQIRAGDGAVSRTVRPFERLGWKCDKPTAGKRQTASLKASSTMTN